MKRFFFPALVFTLILTIPGTAPAVLHVDLAMPAANEWTVTYRFADNEMGSQSMDVLPYEAEIEVIDVVPEKGGNSLEWERINEGEEKKPKIRVKYPETVGPGGKFTFRLTAKMKDPNAYFEDTAKLNFLYRTGHEIHVSLPLGFYPIYTDEAMEVKQEQQRIVLSSRGGKVRPVVIFAVRCSGSGPAPRGVSVAPEQPVATPQKPAVTPEQTPVTPEPTTD